MLLRMIPTDLTILKDPGFLAAGKKYRLGRSSKCSFVVNDLSVSRCHAELAVTETSILVKDLDSLNGTYVDGARITEAEVKPGGTVVFGSAKFQLAYHDAVIFTPENSEVSTCAINDKPSLQPTPEQLQARLSEATRRVLMLLLRGLSEKEVATTLIVSQHTVHRHVMEIYRTMNVHTRAELLALFVSDSKIPD